MTIHKIINEVLVRYDENGGVQGMHVVYRFVVKENDKVVSSSVGEPQAVTLGIEEGLDISEVLGDLNALNIVNIESLTNQLSQANLQNESLTADKNLLVVENERLVRELSEKENEISNLNRKIAELDALKSEMDQNKSDSKATSAANEEPAKL